MGPLQQEKDWAKSLFSAPARVPTAGKQSTIIAKVVEVAIVAAMENSCHQFNNEPRQQTGSLSIGEDASRALPGWSCWTGPWSCSRWPSRTA